MLQKPKHYNAWTDGSYRQERHSAGGGWVIETDPDGRLEGKSLVDGGPLKGDAREYGSQIAELFAVSSALKRIPDGATLTLRTDSREMAEWLKAGKMGKSLAAVREITTLFQAVQSKLAMLARVEVIQITGRNNPNMDRAHQLSRQATTPPKKEKKKPDAARRNGGRPATPKKSY